VIEPRFDPVQPGVKGTTVELRHLRYFVAVAEELHFRRAAERLYVAQPAVSEQVRKLEAELGVRLFNRTTRGVTLTGAGRALLAQARRVLHQAEVAQLAARNADERSTLQLRIGYTSVSLPGSVPRALQQLTSAAPSVEVTLEAGRTTGLTQSLREGWLDAVVAELPAPANGLRATMLGSEHLVAALPVRDDRALEPALRLEQLAPERLVVLPRAVSPALYDAVVSMCRQAGSSPALLETAEPTIESVLLAVASRGVPALLPSSVRERYAAPGVRLVDVVGTEPAFESAVLTRPDNDNLAVARFLRTLARASEHRRHEAPAPALLAAA
jgi:DNA-binding transcriptional LysR family regulator